MRRFVPPLLIVLITAALFGSTVGHDFTNLDDQQTIAQNGELRRPTMESLAHLWTTEAAGLYVPVTYTLWWLIARIAFDGSVMHAWPFHLASVATHAASGLLVWLILRRLQFNQASSLFGALVFVIHPVQVETVAWASGAKDQLAACLSLAAIFTYLKNIPPCTRGAGPPVFDLSANFQTENQNANDTTEPVQVRHQESLAWPSLALMVLAMLAKPSAVMTPFIIAVLDRIYRHQSLRCIFRRLWPSLPAILPIVLIARSVQTIWPAVVTPFWQRPFIAGDALAFYAMKLIWPATLTHLYGRTPMLLASSPVLYWTWLLPMFMALIVLSQWRRRPAIAAGAVIFTLALLPVLGFTPFEFQVHSTVADHYLYLPMFGVALASAAALSQVQSANARRVSTAFAGTILLALFVRSAFQVPVWRNSITLNTRAVEARPQSVDAHGSLAIAFAEAGQVEAALPHLQLVESQVPTNRMVHLRLAQVFLALHDCARAMPEAAAAVRYTSSGDRDPLPNLYLAQALIGLDRRPEAAAALESARRIDPANAEVLRLIESLTNPPTTVRE